MFGDQVTNQKRIENISTIGKSVGCKKRKGRRGRREKEGRKNELEGRSEEEEVRDFRKKQEQSLMMELRRKREGEKEKEEEEGLSQGLTRKLRDEWGGGR